MVPPRRCTGACNRSEQLEAIGSVMRPFTHAAHNALEHHRAFTRALALHLHIWSVSRNKIIAAFAAREEHTRTHGEVCLRSQRRPTSARAGCCSRCREASCCHPRFRKH